MTGSRSISSVTVVLITVPSVILLIIILVGFICCFSRKRRLMEKLESKLIQYSVLSRLSFFSLKTLSSCKVTRAADFLIGNFEKKKKQKHACAFLLYADKILINIDLLSFMISRSSASVAKHSL